MDKDMANIFKTLFGGSGLPVTTNLRVEETPYNTFELIHTRTGNVIGTYGSASRAIEAAEKLDGESL